MVGIIAVPVLELLPREDAAHPAGLQPRAHLGPDGIAAGKITTPEQVDHMAGDLRPTVREKLKDKPGM